MVDFDFIATDTDMIQWRYDYPSKSFRHIETDETFAFKFNPDTGIFTTSSGFDLKIVPMSKYTLADFQHNYRMKHEPLIPQHKVKIGDGENDWILESNENDKRWQLAYTRYTEGASLALLRFLIVYSVEMTIPNDMESRILRIAKRLGEVIEGDEWLEEVRPYYFVKEALGSDEQEMFAFMQCLTGRNMITKESMERSEKRFQNNGSRS